MRNLGSQSQSKLQEISSAMYNTIDGMKHLLKLNHSLQIDKDGKEKFNDANLDAATRLFDTKEARERYCMMT